MGKVKEIAYQQQIAFFVTAQAFTIALVFAAFYLYQLSKFDKETPICTVEVDGEEVDVAAKFYRVIKFGVGIYIIELVTLIPAFY